MNKEERIRLACDRLIEHGDLNVVGELFSAGYVAHAGGKDYEGHDFLRRFAGQIRSAIPDIRVLKVEFLAHTADTVTWQRSLSGTHRADLMGIPPSRKKVTWTDMVVTRFDGEEIAEEWVVSELAGNLLLALPATR